MTSAANPTTTHTNGSPCPLCTTHEVWCDNHCYGCGLPFHPQARPLNARLRTDTLTLSEGIVLDYLTKQHVICFA